METREEPAVGGGLGRETGGLRRTGTGEEKVNVGRD